MIHLQVQIHVKPDAVEAFKTATVANAEGSRREPGVIRFDVYQQADDPNRFLLFETYRTEADVAAHKETAHYKLWRDTVTEMMAETRVGKRFVEIAPAGPRGR